MTSLLKEIIVSMNDCLWYSDMKYNWGASIKITGNSLYGFDNVKYCNSYLGKLNDDRNQNSGKNYSKI